MTTPKMCERCGAKPQGYHGRRWCYGCKPGRGGRPLPCRRCGCAEDYWSERLCRRCHQYAPQRPESCRDCLAWGVRRTEKWLCGGCLSWRTLYPTTQACIACGDKRSVNEHGCCRLCWRQTKLVQERRRDRHRGPLDIEAANRYGQQLFLANMASSKNGYRPRSPRAAPPPVPTPTPPRQRYRRKIQLELFTRDPVIDAARGYGFRDPPDARLAGLLDHAASDHAARHGWSTKKTHAVRTAIRVLLGMRESTGTPIPASEVTRLTALELRARPVLAILEDAGLLRDDRPATIETWFGVRTRDLPGPMANELRIWFDVLHRGSSTPPRSRPRSPITIKNRLNWTLPTLHRWAATGHRSLREITRDDVLAMLPGSGTPRAGLGDGLRSIFRTLKARKVVFVNPSAGINIGNFTRRIPLPADPSKLRAALHSPDPPGAALAALAVFHGLRPLELRELRLIDVRDGRLQLAGRGLLLAEPVTTRLAAYLDYRHRRWPNSTNAHFFIHNLNAGGTNPVGRYWVNDHLGMFAQAIRQDRIVDEAHATGGDLRRICDFFGVVIGTAEHYALSLNHPGLTDTPQDGDATGSRTEDRS